jgi:hypothetical protein
MPYSLGPSIAYLPLLGDVVTTSWQNLKEGFLISTQRLPELELHKETTGRGQDKGVHVTGLGKSKSS